MGSNAVACVVFPGESLTIIDVVFVDDLTYAFLATTPVALQNVLHMMRCKRIATFTAFGLVIHWKPGKTEIVLKFRGAGAGGEYQGQI